MQIATRINDIIALAQQEALAAASATVEAPVPAPAKPPFPCPESSESKKVHSSPRAQP